MTDGATVRPMTVDEYDAWIVVETETYAADLARATGERLEEARARAEQQLRRFLPQGCLTEGVFLMRVLDGVGEPVGTLWVGPHPDRADAGWVYDVEIDEHRRGEGLGRVAMRAAERLSREAGWTALGLNVFGHNARARALYDSLGYAVASTTMTKSLTD
jgi:GNAT superfamily N-acetyltransferase